MSAPGGFVELQGTTPRTKLTTGEIASIVPSTRGVFTFPAPYNTRAWRITDDTDCDGSTDCVWYVGYSYWRNMNYHVNDSVIKIFVGSNVSVGGDGPLLFHLNKSTFELTKEGPVFPVGSAWRNWPGEGWYWNHRNQDWLYISDQTHWYRYNVVNQTEELMIDAVAMWGADREVVQMHSAVDDAQHVFTVRVGSTNAMLGAGYYNEDTATTRFYDHPDMNEAIIDQSGRWTLILENDGSGGLNNYVYDNTTGDLAWSLSEAETALGHTDAGWEFFVGADNLNPLPNATVLWSANPMTFQGVQHQNIDLPGWPIAALNHLSIAGSEGSDFQNQLVYGSSVDDSAYENEVTVVRLNSGIEQLIVAPIMSRLSAAGGSIDYAKFPKGNVDVTGEYFIWTTNLGGDRIDAFVVQVPTQLLIASASGEGDMSQRLLLEAEHEQIWADEVRLAVGSTVVGRTTTVDATPATLISLPLLSGRTTIIRAQVIARRTGGSSGTAEDGAGYILTATYKMVAGTPTLIGAVTTLHSAESQAGWNATCTVSGANVLVEVTGAANNNVTWNGKVHIESVVS